MHIAWDINRSFNYTFKNADSFEICNEQAAEIILTLSATFKGSADQQSVDAKTDFAFLGHDNLFSQIYMTRPEGQTRVITRAQSISLSLSFAVCLGLLSANLLSLCTNQHGTHNHY